MINEPVGIATTPTTWYLLAGLVVLWGISLPLLVRAWRQTSGIVISLLGLSWISFGFGILVRFLLLTINAETFASPSLRLVELSPESVDFALLTAALFWLAFTIGAVITLALPAPGVLSTLIGQADRFLDRPMLPVVAFCSVCVFVSLQPIPGALITPLSVLGSMWVVPATRVWTGHFSGQRRSAWLLAAVLAPGFIRLVLSPYREQILVMALVVVASAIGARRRLNPFVVAPLALVLALLSTVVVTSYRQILWAGNSTTEVLSNLSEGRSINPLTENLQRFHVFDSLLLTVDLVPDVFPHAERNPLIEAVTRGVLPRFLNPGKVQSNQAARFQTIFWSYYNDPTLEPEDATAAIAPSMPGSLYDAGGLRHVAIGGFLWAVVLGVVTRAKRHPLTPAAAGLYVLCAVQAVAGLERDYAMAVSTLLQTLLVFFGLCALGLVSGRRGILALGPRAASPAP